MKNNLTPKVMNKVVGFERRRLSVFIVFALALLLSLLALFGYLFSGTSNSFFENSTLDSLELLKEDWEVIQTYWKDTLIAFISDLPIAFYILVFVAIMGVIVFPKYLAGILQKGKKLLDIEKYQRGRENN